MNPTVIRKEASLALKKNTVAIPVEEAILLRVTYL
jgi:hypothetical protein